MGAGAATAQGPEVVTGAPRLLLRHHARMANPEHSAGAGKGTDDGAATSKDRGASTPTSPTTPSDPPAVTGGSLGSLSTGYAANQSEDLGAVC